MAEKQMDVGTASLGSQDIINVKLKIADDTIGPGNRTNLSITVKNLSPIPLPGVVIDPHLHGGVVTPVILPDKGTFNLEVGEEETCGFLVDNSGNAAQAEFRVNVHVSGIPGYAGPPYFYTKEMKVP